MDCGQQESSPPCSGTRCFRLFLGNAGPREMGVGFSRRFLPLRALRQGLVACTHGIARPQALAVPDGGLPLCPLIRCLERIELQQRPLRRLGLCGDEAAQDGTRDLVAALKWRGACDRKARSHAMNCRTATDDAMDWGLVRGRGRGGTVGQQGPPHPVLGTRNFFVYKWVFQRHHPRHYASQGGIAARALSKSSEAGAR